MKGKYRLETLISKQSFKINEAWLKKWDILSKRQKLVKTDSF